MTENLQPNNPDQGTALKKTTRPARKSLIGVVVSNRMQKTIVVRVERRFPHPRYRKIIRRFKKFYAHDEQNQARIGDTVRIIETRPLSKLKRWRLVEILARATEPA